MTAGDLLPKNRSSDLMCKASTAAGPASRQLRHHRPPAEVLADREPQLVVASFQRQDQLVEQTDRAEESRVARLEGVVAAVERTAVEIDADAIAESEPQQHALGLIGVQRGGGEHRLAIAVELPQHRQIGDSARTRLQP